MAVGSSEERWFTWDDCVGEITRYYDGRGCDVTVEMAEDGSCFDVFVVRPRGKKYFSKLLREERGEDWQERALAALKDIFFPDEAVLVTDVEQSETYDEDDQGDIKLTVIPQPTAEARDGDDGEIRVERNESAFADIINAIEQGKAVAIKYEDSACFLPVRLPAGPTISLRRRAGRNEAQTEAQTEWPSGEKRVGFHPVDKG